MAVRCHIPGSLRPLTGGEGMIVLDAGPTTVGEALALLGKLYPGVRDRVLTERGEVRPHVNVFMGSENIRYTGGLRTPIADGGEISILPAVSGGCQIRFHLSKALAFEAPSWHSSLAQSKGVLVLPRSEP